MDKGQEVRQCLFDFRESGIYVNAMSDDNCTMVIGQLFKDAFTDYVAIGDVGLDELKSLSNMIHTGFDDGPIRSYPN